MAKEIITNRLFYFFHETDGALLMFVYLRLSSCNMISIPTLTHNIKRRNTDTSCGSINFINRLYIQLRITGVLQYICMVHYIEDGKEDFTL